MALLKAASLIILFSISATAAVDPVVVTINNRSIHLEEFNKRFDDARKLLNPPSTRKAFLEDLVRYEVGVQEAEKRNLAKDPIIAERIRQQLYVGLIEKELSDKINNIQMLALVETKSITGPTKNTWRKAGFDNCLVVPSLGLAGGICLLWKNYQMIDDLCEIAHTSTRFIVVKYKNLSTNICMMLIFSYSPPRECDKDAFWTELTNFINCCDIPCLVIGDLNEIKSPSEKMGGTPLLTQNSPG